LIAIAIAKAIWKVIKSAYVKASADNGGVAQLARASALQAEGHRFDSVHLHFFLAASIRERLFFIYGFLYFSQ
jgi:hypothetical protein